MEISRTLQISDLIRTENLATMYPDSTDHRMLDLNACAEHAAIRSLRH
jgi:hypothetical protein